MSDEDQNNLPIGVNFTLMSEKNKEKVESKMQLSDKVKAKLQKFKDEVLAIAKQYETYNKENIDLVNDITSRRDWSDLTAEAKDRTKKNALSVQQAEQEAKLEKRIELLNEKMDQFEKDLTVEILKGITGSEELQLLSKKLGLSPELTNSLLNEVAELQDIQDSFNVKDSFMDLVLRKQLRTKAGKLSQTQRTVAEERVGLRDGAVGGYNTIKKILAGYKGQVAFVSNTYYQYSPNDLNKMQVFERVKQGLAKVGK